MPALRTASFSFWIPVIPKTILIVTRIAQGQAINNMMIFIIEAPVILLSVPNVIILIPTMQIGNIKITFMMLNLIYRFKARL